MVLLYRFSSLLDEMPSVDAALPPRVLLLLDVIALQRLTTALLLLTLWRRQYHLLETH